MLSHFTYKSFLSTESRRREYQFSFFYKGEQYQGIYHYTGAIDWHTEPTDVDKAFLTSHVHELMLFHVYE